MIRNEPSGALAAHLLRMKGAILACDALAQEEIVFTTQCSQQQGNASQSPSTQQTAVCVARKTHLADDLCVLIDEDSGLHRLHHGADCQVRPVVPAIKQQRVPSADRQDSSHVQVSGTARAGAPAC